MRRAKAKKDTSERILRAAEEVLAESGVAASVGQVAKRAGVNKALVFYYFDDKADLFEKVLERYYVGHLAALEDAFEVQGDLRERLHSVIDAYIDYIHENRRYPRLVQQMISAAPEQANNTLIQKNLQPLYEWTTKALSEVAPKTGPLAARQFFITFSGMVIWYFTNAPVLGGMWGGEALSDASLVDRRQHVHWMVDVVLNALDNEN